ncbi:hypothetical protein BDB13_6073 [Rhodococcus sp. OK302]|nr:hypothetical protein BDB13_6073 [Rhodococcus sp. OK302]
MDRGVILGVNFPAARRFPNSSVVVCMWHAKFPKAQHARTLLVRHQTHRQHSMRAADLA